MSLVRESLPTHCNFGAPFDVPSCGPGYSFGGVLNDLPGNVLEGIERCGTVRFRSTFTPLSWTATNPETWAGLTAALVPEPAVRCCGEPQRWFPRQPGV